MKSNKICKVLLLFMMIMIAFAIHSACYAESEKVTDVFKIGGYTKLDGVLQYNCYVTENVYLSVKASDFDLPSNLYAYRDSIRLILTYTEGDESDYKIYECKVMNYENEEIIEDLSEENIEKLFSIEYGKDINEKKWTDKIKLSELEESKIYKYTADETVQFPEIENDIGKNCIIYIKGRLDSNYQSNVSMGKNIKDDYPSVSDNEYKTGESFCISYKLANNSELLKLIKPDKIIYLNKYKDGDELEVQFQDYIYNNTNKDIAVNIHNKTESIIIGKGEIYGFDWMLLSASISYVKNSEKDENNDTDKDLENKVDNDNKQNSNDNTIIPDSKLPQTGTSNIVIILILSFITIISVMIIKLRNLKDIK